MQVSPALVPDAPLLVDDFGNDALVKTVCGLPKASQFLEAERRRHPKGFINLERLMSRLDTLMPYDFDHKAVDEIAFLYSALKRSFLNTLASARAGKGASDDIRAFVAHWAVNGATCITFNYDDFLDQALLSSSSIWNPEWGYGFYCRSSSTSVSSIGGDRLPARSLLLKLHGSVNWRGLLGHEQPYALAAIVHHQEWGTADVPHLRPQIERHLDPDPVIVPPVLTKSGLVAQPVLRLVWTRAFARLAAADGVTFIGYSFPPTDAAARVLFSEALRDLPADRVTVVGLACSDTDKAALRSRYRDVLGDIPDERFCFDGAVAWIRGLETDRDP